MTKFVGRRGELGLAKESSRGTATEPTVWLGRNTISFDDRTTTARSEEGLGRIEQSNSNFVVNKMGEGEFEIDLDDTQFGLILTSLIGASPSTTGGPTYTHDYTLQNNNQHQTLSVAYQDPDTTKIFPNAVVDSLSITVDTEQIVKATVGFKSRVGREWSTLTADVTGLGQKFLQQHLQLKLAAAVGSLSGASAISAKQFTININANTEFDSVLGTVEPEDILNTQFNVSGSINLNKEDETYRGYMLDGTYRAMEFKLNRASDSSFRVQLPRVDFTEWEQDRSNDDIVQQSINFNGNYDAANGNAILSTVELINTDDGTNY